MTAGQGPGPYGNPTGQGGAPDQPEPQGWGSPQYGAPPPGQPPYGPPPSGQPPHGPPSYGQPPYGQPSYGPPVYGPPPYPGYGAAPSAPTGYGAPTPVERPLTVRAGIGAFVGSIVLSLVAHVIGLLNLDTLTELATTQSGLGELTPEEAEIAAAASESFGTFGLVLGVVFTGVFALFVWFAWRGYNWARVVLWVLAGLGIVFGVIGAGLGSSFGAVTLPVLTFLTWVEVLFDAVAIVLLALKPSNEWYRYRGWLRSTGQPG